MIQFAQASSSPTETQTQETRDLAESPKNLVAVQSSTDPPIRSINEEEIKKKPSGIAPNYRMAMEKMGPDTQF